METELRQTVNAAVEQYRRLVGCGYDREAALRMVGDSFRDLLHKRRLAPQQPVYEQQQQLQQEKYNHLTSPTTQSVDQPAAGGSSLPVIGQKIVARKDIGRVVWVGPRFISVAWIKGNMTQRIGKRRFMEAVKGSQYVLLPKIRVAQNLRKNHE